jgi:hypothetical protein
MRLDSPYKKKLYVLLLIPKQQFSIDFQISRVITFNKMTRPYSRGQFTAPTAA